MRPAIDDNPYRSFAVEPDNESPLADEWELNAYIVPRDEPILSPQQVRDLAFDSARQSNLFTVSLVCCVLAFMFAGRIDRDLGRSIGATTADALAMVCGGLAILSHAGAVAFAYRTGATLLPTRLIAAGIAALVVVPLFNFLPVGVLRSKANLELARHGIEGSLFAFQGGSLPRRRRAEHRRRLGPREPIDE